MHGDRGRYREACQRDRLWMSISTNRALLETDSYVEDKSTVARNSCGQKEKVDEKERLSTFIYISL